MTEPPMYAGLLAQLEGPLADVPPLPREIAVSDGATLDALIAGAPKGGPSPLRNPLGSLLGIPLLVDDALPTGEVHIREHDGRVSAIWRLGDGGRWISLPVAGRPDAIGGLP
jgi:hypothetical protein